MNAKKCPKCNNIKKIVDFNICKARSDGRQAYCKICSSNKAKAAYLLDKNKVINAAKERKQKITNDVNVLRSTLGCRLCSEKEFCCIDFHHIGNKKDNIAYLCSVKNKQKIYNELLKCVPLCANCHRKIHAKLINEKLQSITQEELTILGW